MRVDAGGNAQEYIGPVTPLFGDFAKQLKLVEIIDHDAAHPPLQRQPQLLG